jgi:hydroxyacylglutathione hydrolase
MYFKQFYLGCLAHASYLIGSDGEAAVVDPQRDVELYIATAASELLEIRYVIETHLHADFVSGHRELAARTGAEIVFGARANVGFPHRAVKDGDEIAIGNVTLRFLETPGHTPESISILVIDSSVSPNPEKVLTGDTLFIGDVGRPDLAGAKGYTPEQMAGMLYDSLHDKLLKLDDSVGVFPAHGAGSLCGRSLSSETSSTIGEQKRLNYAIGPMSKADFVRMMTTDMPAAPSYFERDAEINRSGAAPLKELVVPREMDPAEVQARSSQGSLVLDTRSPAAFGTGHIPGAVNIGLSGQFASWAGSLVPPTTSIILVTEEISQVDEAVMRLARVGLDKVEGYLGAGMYAWHEAGLEVASMPQMPVDELRHELATGLQVIDVRRAAEYKAGHVPGAVNTPLSELEERVGQVERKGRAAVICASGYRSSIAASLMERRGWSGLFNVVGGTQAWVAAGNDVE